MKALIQRVTTAKVTGNDISDSLNEYWPRKIFYIVFRALHLRYTVNDELISSIGRGLCVLIGISHDDTIKDVEYM